MSGLILHHYDFSNFAEKARLMLGFKGLAWLGVEQPPILPKPDLVPLTGGYRRIPVLQDGADLWCDTRLIARELERRVPSPTLFPAATAGAAEAIAWWAEQQFMRPVALYVSGINADHMPAGLHEDRARLHGLPPPSIEAVRKAAIRNLHLVRPQIRWLADMLTGRPALSAGRRALHRRLRGLSCGVVLQGPAHRLPATSSVPTRACWRGATAWRRSGTASGPTSLPTKRWRPPARPSLPRRAPRNRRTAIRGPASAPACGPADNARDWVEGEVAFIDAHEIALLRQDPQVGRVAVHFPRLGYDWRRL